MNDSITCPKCGAVSHHPKDIDEGYCGRCHEWTSPEGGVVHLVCAPTADITKDDVTPHSIRQMAGCGHEVWVSPSGQRQQKESFVPVTVVCIMCLPSDINEKPRGVAPGALEEIADHYGVAHADQYKAFLHHLGWRT